MQERYVASAGSATARTVLFDELGPIDWPAGVDGRALRNRFTDANPEHLLAKACPYCAVALRLCSHVSFR